MPECVEEAKADQLLAVEEEAKLIELPGCKRRENDMSEPACFSGEGLCLQTRQTGAARG